MHLQLLPPKDSNLRGFLYSPVQWKKMGIIKCCILLEKVHNLLHMLQPALAWEQAKVLVYYIKLHKRWKKNVITICYVHNRSFELPLLSEVGISVSGL